MMYRHVKRVTSSDITISDCFNQFITEKKSLGLSEPTIHNYIQTFEFFCRDNDLEETDLMNVTANMYYEWINKLKERGIHTASINHYITDSRVFFYWCMNNNYISRFTIRLLKGQEEPIKFFNDVEIAKLLDRKRTDDSFVEHRTYAIICFILSTGARASTVVNIKIDDVDFVTKEITYRHLKNKKSAIIPLSYSVEKVLREYLRSWNLETEWLFSDVAGNQLTTSALRQALEKYCTKKGVEPRGPHALRHSFARGWIKNGGNAFALQKILTHSDISMTKRYVRLFDEELKVNFSNYSPLERYI